MDDRKGWWSRAGGALKTRTTGQELEVSGGSVQLVNRGGLTDDARHMIQSGVSQARESTRKLIEELEKGIEKADPNALASLGQPFTPQNIASIRQDPERFNAALEIKLKELNEFSKTISSSRVTIKVYPDNTKGLAPKPSGYQHGGLAGMAFRAARNSVRKNQDRDVISKLTNSQAKNFGIEGFVRTAIPENAGRQQEGAISAVMKYDAHLQGLSLDRPGRGNAGQGLPENRDAPPPYSVANSRPAVESAEHSNARQALMRSTQRDARGR